MKMCYAYLLIFSLAVVSGCMSMSGYKEASLRHHAYATGTTHATATEWRALISEFQRVIDANPKGSSADDAQYAIASSWLWIIKTGDTETSHRAIEAFKKLIYTYPNSEYVPFAYYWLGRCYDAIGDDYQAIVQYQLVENRYADSEMSAFAKLELARLYARQGYVKRAERFYENLINGSGNHEIGVAASIELQALKTQRKPVVSPPQNTTQKQQIVRQPIKQEAQQPQQAKQVQQSRQTQQPKLSERPQQTKPVVPTSKPKPLTPKSLTREFGLTAKTIVIDPGHGGKDPGALGTRTLQEKGIVLSISEKLREVLTAKGYTVLMTRETDHFIPLKQRTEFAIQHKADLFLSIHANGSETSRANGIETYYLNVTSTDDAAEKVAARENIDSGYSIQELETLLEGLIRESKSEDSKRLAQYVQQALVQSTGAADRGVKHARFVVLIGTKVPAILIETGFVSNAGEGQKLATSAYQYKVATAIAEGVDRFLGKTGETPFVAAQSPKLAATSVERDR